MTDKNLCIDCMDANCFIKQCFPEWIKRISEKKQVLQYRTGDIIFKQGDPVKGIYFVKHGKVKVIFSKLNREEQIVRLAGNGHILGHRGFAGETYPISALAMDNSQICFIDNDTIFAALYNNLQFTIALMLYYSKELRSMEARMSFLLRMNEQEKMAYSLLYIKDVFGYDPMEEENVINACVSTRDIASLSVIPQKQIEKLLGDFENEKIISVKNARITILKEEVLQEMVDSYL